MIRSFAISLGSVLALAASASAQDSVAKEPTENRRDVIKQVQDDLDAAQGRLKQDDAGNETRQAQDRIIAGLKKLIEQQDENQSRNNSSSDSASSSKNRPEATPKPASPSAEPAPRLKPVPSKAPADAPVPIAKEKQVGKGGPANTLADLAKECKAMGAWGQYPTRLRSEMDAFGRERFIRNYEELLRAYYRTLAESGRQSERE